MVSTTVKTIIAGLCWLGMAQTGVAPGISGYGMVGSPQDEAELDGQRLQAEFDAQREVERKKELDEELAREEAEEPDAAALASLPEYVRKHWEQERARKKGLISGDTSQLFEDARPFSKKTICGKVDAPSPAVWIAHFETTQGAFNMTVHGDWAPRGASRFFTLMMCNYYSGARFFRVIESFVAQWGLSGDPKEDAAWFKKTLRDDPMVNQHNDVGMVSFAMSGANSRTTQVFVNTGGNRRLDKSGFVPFAKVDAEGMKVVQALYNGYEKAGDEPDQSQIMTRGNAYLDTHYPKLDRIEVTKVYLPKGTYTDDHK